MLETLCKGTGGRLHSYPPGCSCQLWAGPPDLSQPSLSPTQFSGRNLPLRFSTSHSSSQSTRFYPKPSHAPGVSAIHLDIPRPTCPSTSCLSHGLSWAEQHEAKMQMEPREWQDMAWRLTGALRSSGGDPVQFRSRTLVSRC